MKGVAMNNLILSLILFAHGVGHILFVANARGYWRSETTRGWLFTRLLPMSQTVEGIVGLLWLIPLAGFLIGTWGYYTNTSTWQTLLLASAVISSVLILLWWGSINLSSASFALLANVAVIGVILWARPDTTPVG
jgi:hypothetical protein